MGILNKRNAVLGWLTWKVGKGMAKKKARGAVPRRGEERKRRKPTFFAGLAAALGSVFFFARKRKGQDQQA